MQRVDSLAGGMDATRTDGAPVAPFNISSVSESVPPEPRKASTDRAVADHVYVSCSGRTRFHRLLLLGLLIFLQHGASVGVFFVASAVWSAAFAAVSALVVALVLWRVVSLHIESPRTTLSAPAPGSAAIDIDLDSVAPSEPNPNPPEPPPPPPPPPPPQVIGLPSSSPAIAIPAELIPSVSVEQTPGVFPSSDRSSSSPALSALDARDRDVSSLMKVALSAVLTVSVVSAPLLGFAVVGLQSPDPPCPSVGASSVSGAVDSGATCFEFASSDRPVVLDSFVCASTASGIELTLTPGAPVPQSSELAYFAVAVASEAEPSTILFWHTSSAPLSAGLRALAVNPQCASLMPQSQVSLFTGAVSRCSSAYTGIGKVVSPPLYLSISSRPRPIDYQAMLGVSAAMLILELVSWYTLLAASFYFLLTRSAVSAPSSESSAQTPAAAAGPSCPSPLSIPGPQPNPALLEQSPDDDASARTLKGQDGQDSDPHSEHGDSGLCSLATAYSAARGLKALRQSTLRARRWTA